jgi:hypothetical protein
VRLPEPPTPLKLRYVFWTCTHSGYDPAGRYGTKATFAVPASGSTVPFYYQKFQRPAVLNFGRGPELSFEMAQTQSKLPELDEKYFLRNQKTAWLQYLDKLAVWIWQDNEGAARWTLILDDVPRLCALRFDFHEIIYPAVALYMLTDKK